MRFLLDTNACIALIKQKPAAAIRRLAALAPGEAGLSSVTLAELHYGVQKSAQTEQNAAALCEFLLPLEVVPFDAEAAEAYGRVRAGLEKIGTPIGALDTLIGAHALSLSAILITNNTREFGRIAGLRVEDWTR
jgi:tRNA(fMet)-specific endonuclease VapC